MPSVPGAPTAVSATAGNAVATVAFTPPASNGGATITGYTVTSTPSSFTATGAASPLTVNGLANGTPYTFTVHATNSVGNSVESTPSNSVTPATTPTAPTAVSASPGNQRAIVSFTAPGNTGGSPITGYTVTATDTTNSAHGGQVATGTVSPITITGLTNTENYTFTVHATNAVGNSPESLATAGVIPTTTVPDPPLNALGVVGIASAVVSWAPPANNGGQPITGYTVTATDTIVPANGGQTATSMTSPVTVKSLTPGDAYTFVVTATNSLGTSAPSSPTGLVTPANVQSPVSSAPPFASCTAYTVTKQINAAQIQDELTAAAGQTVQVSLSVNTTDMTLAISPSNPGLLWVSPSTIPAATVNTVIAAHVANPNYGQPQSTQDYLTVLALVQSNYATVLTSDQIQTAIKGLMLRVASQQQAGLSNPSN